jgi:hypothetical protein
MFRLQLSCIPDLCCSGYYLAKVRTMNGTVTVFLDGSFRFSDQPFTYKTPLFPARNFWLEIHRLLLLGTAAHQSQLLVRVPSGESGETSLNPPKMSGASRRDHLTHKKQHPKDAFKYCFQYRKHEESSKECQESWPISPQR